MFNASWLDVSSETGKFTHQRNFSDSLKETLWNISRNSTTFHREMHFLWKLLVTVRRDYKNYVTGSISKENTPIPRALVFLNLAIYKSFVTLQYSQTSLHWFTFEAEKSTFHLFRNIRFGPFSLFKGHGRPIIRRS